MNFPLAGLLRVRRLQQDQLAGELSRANRRQRDADRRTQKLAGVLAGTSAEALDLGTLMALAATRASTRAMLDELRAVQHETAAELEAARTAHEAARAATTSLEKLEERHDERVAVEELRAEQTVLDEVAGRAWLLANRETDR